MKLLRNLPVGLLIMVLAGTIHFGDAATMRLNEAINYKAISIPSQIIVFSPQEPFYMTSSTTIGANAVWQKGLSNPAINTTPYHLYDAFVVGADAVWQKGLSNPAINTTPYHLYDAFVVGVDAVWQKGLTNPAIDTISPTISSVSPEDGDPNVAADTMITATFSEAMDSSTITTESFTLAGSEVSGTVTYDPDTYTATFTPDADLDCDHEYTATLSTAITDEAGNPLAEAYTWSFTTTLGEPKFLTLPFGDPGVEVQQGWVYTFNPDPDAHQGIDYIKGEIDNAFTWQSFDVVAAADGVAMQSSSETYGRFVLIQHNETDSLGNNYFTLYAHLDRVDSGIPAKDKGNTDYSTWKPIQRGEFVGTAGSTGVHDQYGNLQPSWIHLHFEVNRGGYTCNRVDPYDLYNTRDSYPGGNNYTVSGSNYLWTTDPPSYSIVGSNVVVTNPLAITASSDGFLYFGGQLWCFQGDTISAEFTVTNRGPELVTLEKLVVWGRDPTGEVIDFTPKDNIALEPGNSYDYQGQLVLPDKTGAYSFFCAYSTFEEGWNTCMDVELDGVLLEDPQEADEFRTKRIEVLSTELLPSALPPPAVWEKVEGPWNEGDCTLSTVAVDPNNPNIILAAVSYNDDYWGYVGDELHRSTDGGATWSLVGQGLPRIPLLPGSHLKEIEGLAIALSDSNIVYAGLSSGGVGVYRSMDGGITWAPTSGPFVEVYFGLGKRYPYVLSVAIDDGNADVVYVGTEHYGVWKTTDGGEHWYEWGIPSAGPSEIYRNYVDVLVVVSADPRAVYGSGCNYVPGINRYYPLGIYQRVDSNGDDWCKKDPIIIDESYFLPLTPLVTDIAVAPDGQTIYFATNHNTVYLSEDGGASWENASGGGGRNHLPESGNGMWNSTDLPCSLIVDPAYPNVIYASHAASGVWWSYNSGDDWFPAGLQDVGVVQTVSDRDTSVLYAVGALNGSLYKLDISSNWVTVIRKHSPGELRVYDVQGNVTGMIDGQIVENIPNSGYDPLSDTVVIWATVNPFVFEVVGTEDGAYGLTAGLVGTDDYTAFSAANIPTSADATHQYSINWDTLSQGEEGVTVQVDSDGDGEFEDTFTADDELTQDEFQAATNTQPIADAGPDQTVYVTPLAITAQVTLDGSGSYDPDGDPSTYTWTWDSSIASGVNPTIDLPLGTTTINLIVNDGILDSLPDTVDITVIQAPTGGPWWFGGWGDGWTLPPLKLNVDMWGMVSSWDMDEDGVLLEDVDATSPDGKVSIHIPAGTRVLGPDGEPLDEIGVTSVDPPPTPPEGYHVIAAFEFEPDGATFDREIEIIIVYGQDAISVGVDETNLVIAFLDKATGQWILVTGVVDAYANTITFTIAHFTIFAVMAAPAPVPVPSPTPVVAPTPTPTPSGGLSTSIWVGIGIAGLFILGLVVWLVLRRPPV